MIAAASHPAQSSLAWVWIPLLLFGVLPTVTSLLGGWHALAQLYRRRGRMADGQRYLFASFYLRSAWCPLPMSYRGGSVVVRFGSEGIGLASWPPFSLLLPPLLIPWGAVVDCRRTGEGWGMQRVCVQLAEPNVVIGFYGAAAQRVNADYGRYRVTRTGPVPAPPSFQTMRLPGARWLRRKFHDWSGQ